MDGRSNRSIRPSSCIVCRHDRRAQVEALLVGGASLRTVAERFGGGLNKDSLSRHMRNHTTPQRRAELMAGPENMKRLADQAHEESRSVLEHARIAVSVTANRLFSAAEGGDNHAFGILSGRYMEAIRLFANVTGEIRTAAGISITNNVAIMADPRMLELRSGLLSIVRNRPEVRAEVIALLHRLDASPAVAPAIAAPPLIDATPADAA